MAYHRGGSTLRIDASVFAENRARLCAELKARDAPPGSWVLLQGNKEVPIRPGSDCDYFRQDGYFIWAFGVEEPQLYGAIGVDSGKSILFAPRLDDFYATWMGKLKTNEEFKAKYGVDEVHFSDEIGSVLTAENPSNLLLLLMKAVKAGMYEYQLERGPNCAILHYGHAGEPNSRLLTADDMCLFDMGAEYCGYTADITCSFPVSGKFSADQKLIYNAVLRANLAVQNALKPGVMWTEMHLLAERNLLEALREGGLIEGDIEQMMSARLATVFQPHGLGHLLGIDVHDVGGYPPDGAPRSTEPGLKSLRTARKMAEGMVITVEPGCYFNPYLLENAFANPRHRNFLVKDVIKRFWNFGGVRIEDDILITASGCENLNKKIPRTVEAIENYMKK